MLKEQDHIRPQFGEIWMCDLSGRDGSVQSGYRPVLVISNDKNNTYSSVVNIIPITTKMSKRLPVHVEIWNYQKYGLKAPSTMLVEQITTVNADSLERKIGNVRDRNVLFQINKAMLVQFPVLSA